MNIPLQILIVEDSEDDTLLLVRLLRKGGYDPIYERVETAEALQAALDRQDWDIIISDFQMPRFSGLDALAIYSQSGLEIPFIIVSGTIGEDVAVNAMRAGAHDYLMKGSLARLLPAIQRELHEAEIRRANRRAEHALQESEHRYRELFESAPEVITLLGLDGTVLDCNPAVEPLVGISREKIIGKHFTALDIMSEEEKSTYMRYFSQFLTSEKLDSLEVQIRSLRGDYRWLDIHLAHLRRAGELWAIQVIGRDITERKSAHEALQHFAERLTILHEIDLAILAANSAEETARAALHHMRRLISCRAAGIVIMDDETQEVVLFASDADGADTVPVGSRFSLNTDVVPEMLATLRRTEPFVLEDTSSLAEAFPQLGALSAAGLNTILNVPLLFQDELFGFMCLAAETADVFGEEEIEIAYEIAIQLAIAIHQARLHQQVSQHAAELEARVAARTAELQAANERLQILSRTKDDFVSNVSHELRTPITNIKLQLYLAGRRPDQRVQYDAVVRREVDRFESLIEGLLTLSRLDQGRQSFKFEPIDLNQLLKRFVADREALADTQSIDMSLQTIHDIGPIHGDRRLLEQVLSILVTNALAYTPAGGQITICSLKRQQEDATWTGFSVSDTGLGISQSEIGRLFDRFFRGSAGVMSQVSGTGLGLSIAKEVIDRHKGCIEVESEGEAGKGSTFTVWLPCQ